MALKRTYPQHSAREHGTAAMFLAAILLAFAIVFIASIPQAFALEATTTTGGVEDEPEAVISETVPVQTVPLFETLSGYLSEADTAWATSQTDFAGYTNQTVSLVLSQQADLLRVVGIASFVAIGFGGLAIAFVMRRNAASRSEVLQYN